MGRVHAIPLVGQVAAGQPILAAENIETTIPLPDELASDSNFLLKVKGDSMIEAGSSRATTSSCVRSRWPTTETSSSR